jgi:hypothetical protein
LEQTTFADLAKARPAIRVHYAQMLFAHINRKRLKGKRRKRLDAFSLSPANLTPA